eukprot:671733-Ditylum_brightwellii.AAC.1
MSVITGGKHHYSTSGDRGDQGGCNVSFGRRSGQWHFKTSSSSSSTDPPQVPHLLKIGLKDKDFVEKNCCDIQNNLVKTYLQQLIESLCPYCFITPVTTFPRLMLASSSLRLGIR